MPFARHRPYDDLPPLPPAGVDLETKPVLKRAITATRALAELKGVGNLIPNQSVLVRVIALQEAKLSSEIESIFTTDDDLYRAFSQEWQAIPPSRKCCATRKRSGTASRGCASARSRRVYWSNSPRSSSKPTPVFAAHPARESWMAETR
jgi:Fic/DOC family N-terminal